MTILLPLYFWFLPWYTWEAALPKKQQVPKVYTKAVRIVRPFDVEEFNKQYCRQPHKKVIIKPLAK